MSEHRHDWRVASITTKAGSTLMECCLEGCDETAYMLTGPAAQEMGQQLKEKK